MKILLNIVIIANDVDYIVGSLNTLTETYEVSYIPILDLKTLKDELEQQTIHCIVFDVQFKTIDLDKLLIIAQKAAIYMPLIAIRVDTGLIARIDLMKAGVRDCIADADLALLPLVVKREVATTCSAIALKNKENTTAHFLEHCLDVLFIHDGKTIKEVSKGGYLQLGYVDGCKLVDQVSLLELIHPEDRPLIITKEQQQNTETPVFIPNVRLLKKDGALLVADLSIVFLGFPDLWYVQAHLQAMTRQKKVVHNPLEKEQDNLLTRHVELVPGVIYQFQMFPDKSFCFPFISDRIFELSGITAQELMEDGTKLFDSMHEGDIRRFIESGYRSKVTLEEWNLDYRVRLPNDGGIRWMRGSSKPVRLSDGSTLWYGYVADITEDKKASAALRDSEEQVRTMFNHAPDAILLLDMEGVITKWNPKAEIIFGWTEKEAVGKVLHELIGPPRNYDIYRKNVEIYRKEGDGIILNQALEVRAVHKNKQEFSITMALSEMSIKGEQFFIVFLSDITQRKNAEERLKESLREKEVLLKEIHHRVKNNMQVITSLLSLQSSFIEDATIRDIFKNSQYRINSMGMVHEMLYQSEDLSKINYGNYLRHLIEGLILAMKGDLNKIDLQLDAPNVSLNIDTAIPLGLIINELVTNSLKYGFPKEQKGTIFVKLTALESPNLKLEIGDNGIGFSKLNKSSASQSLGLMLVKRLSIQLKGEIEHLEQKEGTHYVLSFQEIYPF
ncbi:sensor histidine kinase [Aureispira anguillae]|uniref:histidine kinase n=1 Tax=Aureispira anguillae TaxID=2864201 RepID=A0A915YHT3_9BACT|nr:PAS domain S-box protein [Aureispira anguillae]BDS13445.1 PAS domain S-box protein [Aureispira anguillae]